MSDADYGNNRNNVIDFVEDSIRADPYPEEPFKFVAQWLADSVGIFCEGAGHKPDDRLKSLGRKSIKRSSGRTTELHIKRLFHQELIHKTASRDLDASLNVPQLGSSAVFRNESAQGDAGGSTSFSNIIPDPRNLQPEGCVFDRFPFVS
jgi:hypothetical protein